MEHSKICRLCLGNGSESIELFGEIGKELKIVTIIAQYFWFEPKENDNYSHLICSMCWTDLKNFNEFYNRIKSAQNSLLNADPQKLFPLDKNVQHVKQEVVLMKDEHFQNEYYDGFEDDKYDSASEKSSSSSCSSEPKSFRRITRKRKIDSKEVEINKDPPKRKRGRPPKNSKNLENYPVRTVTKPVLTEEEKLERKSKVDDEDKKIRDFFELACNMCDFRSITFQAVKGHYRKVHSTKRGYVSCCNKKFFRRGRILEHIDWHANPNTFNCTVCHKSYRDKRGLKVHMLNHADDDKRLYKCDICERSYVKKYKLSQHMRITHIPKHMKIHKCPKCNKTFGTRSYLQVHIRGVHEFAYATVCDICAKVFKSKAQCVLHRQEHFERKPKVQCTICETWHKNELGLYKHIRRSHNQSPQTCKICGKVSANRDALRGHVRYVHESQRLHKCSFCEKAFKKPLELREHMASHTGGILYICSFCPKTFNSNANMHSHRKKMHPVEWLEEKERKTGPIPDIL